MIASLELGVIQQRVYPDGTVQPLSTDEAPGHLFLSLHQSAPRISMQPPSVVDVQSVPADGPLWPYAQVAQLTLSRPLYLRVMTLLLVLLVTAASAYAVFMRPLDQLVINSGSLILGIWGIRAILLGPNVPGITSVDLSLSTVILFLLAAITFRAFWSSGRRIGARIPGVGRLG